MPRIKRVSIKPADVTWYKAYDIYEQEKERYNVSESTLKIYRITFEKWNKVFDIDETVNVPDAAAYTYDEFVDILREQGLKADSINTYCRNIHHFFRWLNQRNFINDNRIAIVVKTDDPLPKFLTDEEVETLLTSPYNRNSFTECRSYTLICLMLATGIRVGSAAELLITDWNREEETLTLRKTKTRKQQVLYLSAAASEVLDDYYYSFLKGTNIKYLFPGIYGEKIGVVGLEKAHKTFCANRGVKNDHLHSLRHTMARNWVKSGGSVYKLQKALNHKSINSTAVYARLVDQDLIRDFEEYNVLSQYVGTKRTIKPRRRN